MKSSRSPGRSIFGSESRQVDAVWDDGDGGAPIRTMDQRAILLRHDHHFAIAANPFLLESPPAPIVPALAEPGRAVANLPVQSESDVVLHQHVAAIGGEHGVFHLQRPRFCIRRGCERARRSSRAIGIREPRAARALTSAARGNAVFVG